MDRLTRKELKTDRFALEVGHTVEYIGRHRRQAMIIGGIALVMILLGVGTYFYRQRQHNIRQAELRDALRIYEAAVGPGSSDFIVTFPTQEEKAKAVTKALTRLASQHPGTDEGSIARYYLGVLANNEGSLAEARKTFEEVGESGNKAYASVARLSLAQLYQAQGKTAEAEKLLRSLMEEPTILVSKEQATIALGGLLAASRPEEARKLLEPLRTERSAVSRSAISVLSEIPGK